ncbi:MAG: hypothetical protein K8J31_30485 [Anaerolineae bacterium]|nr:hypothetical protein [Anaerolineae bacterium]
MGALPTNTLLGKLEILEIYEYFDEPLLFVCQNASAQLYLAVLEDEDDDSKTWLYAGLSPTRLQQVRSGGVDLYNAFRHAEDGFVFVVKIYDDDHKLPELSLLSTEDLRDDQLPELSEALSLQTATLERKDISVERRAEQLYREYIELALNFPEQNRTEAPILVLSDIMRYLQDTLISIGHTIGDLYRETKNPSKDLISRMELSLLDVSAGSFKLEMASSQRADMFGDSLLGDALEGLRQLIAIGGDEQGLEAVFSNYKPSVPNDYLKLLRAIKNSRINNAQLKWASANGQKVGEAEFLLPMVISTIDVIEQMVITETTFIEVIGRLTGAFTDREFEIATREEVYSGRLDMEALSIEASEVINNATLGNRYRVQLRVQVTRRIATNETTTKYFLVDVESTDF